MRDSNLRYAGVGLAALGFVGSTFVFVRVQVLQSYPFYDGLFGSDSFFMGITYTMALEIFTVFAALGVFLWAYSRAVGPRQARLVKGVGLVLLVFGILVSMVVYVETRLLWGEILPGIQVWKGLPGGGGYPWGTERVAYNTCLVPSGVQGSCVFLNYNELLLMALLGIVIGFVLWYGTSEESPSPPGED